MLIWGFSVMADASNSQYRWSGSLQATNIRALYERCQRVRLTGLMKLKQGDQVLEMMWIGGEPIEGEAEQGTRSLPLWSNGEFIVEQRIPDFRGQLTGGIETSGSLRTGLVQAIYKLCADNVLSADVDLVRGNGEAAQVRFSLGKAESATINKQTESALTALSKLSGWTDGTYRVVLRPVFTEGSSSEAPAAKAKKSTDDKFDLTGSVNIDVSKGVDWPPKGDDSPVGSPVPMDAPSSPGNVPRPPLTPPKSVSTSGPTPVPATPSGPTPGVVPPRLHSTLVQNPGANATPGAGAATVPMSTVTRDMLAKQAHAQAAQAAQATPAAPAKKGGSNKLVVGIAVFVLLALAATVAVLFLMRAKGGLTSSPPVTRTFVAPIDALDPCCKSTPSPLQARWSS